MKTGFLIFNLLFAVVFCAFSQADKSQTVEVEEITKVMSKGYVSGYKVVIPKATVKEVEEAWEDAARVDTKSKMEKENNELVIQQTNLKAISSRPLNVYAVANPYPAHVEMHVFFEVDSQFINKEKNESAALAAQLFLRNFAADVYRASMTQEVKDEEKKLKKMNKELDKIISGNEKIHKKINSSEREINTLKREIATNEADQNRYRDQIQKQKDEVMRARNQRASEVVIDDAEDKLDDLEKELSKLQKEEDKMHREIDDIEADIREYKREIADNQQLVDLKRTEITRQRERVHQKEIKKESIK